MREVGVGVYEIRLVGHSVRNSIMYGQAKEEDLVGERVRDTTEIMRIRVTVGARIL